MGERLSDGRAYNQKTGPVDPAGHKGHVFGAERRENGDEGGNGEQDKQLAAPFRPVNRDTHVKQPLQFAVRE